MARVFRARDTVLGVDCAVKLLVVPDLLRDELRTRLRSEAHAMARVRHAHVLRVLDVGTDGGQDWIAMDLALGGSLEERFEAEGPLPPRDAAMLHADVLDALHAAHEGGVIHRDVKPSNLLLTDDGRVMLADFGIARVDNSPLADRSTRTGVAMGTLAYMAPEQRLDARSVSAAADVYAVAASLYWLVTGWNPVDLFAADPQSTRWDVVPEGLRPILIRATRHDPRQRYGSAAAFAEALRAVIPDLGAVTAVRVAAAPRTPTLAAPDTPPPELRPLETLIPTDPEANTVPPAPPVVRRRSWPLAAGLVVFVIAGPAIWWATRPPAPAPVAAVQPVPAPTAVEAPDPDPVVEGVAPVPTDPAPEVIPVVAPRPRPVDVRLPDPAPDVVPDAEIASDGAPSGRWAGSFGGRSSSVVLSGPPGALTGTVVVKFAGNEVASAVRGTYDAETRAVVLRDVEQTDDAGTYRGALSPDGTRLSGQFERVRGGAVPFVWNLAR